jgi:hypothetical protein
MLNFLIGLASVMNKLETNLTWQSTTLMVAEHVPEQRKRRVPVSRTASGSSGQQNDEMASGTWGVVMLQCDGNLEFQGVFGS